MAWNLDASPRDDDASLSPAGLPSAGSLPDGGAWDLRRPPSRALRLRLARELHDQAGWHIAALNYGLFAAERDPGNPEKLREVRHRLDALSAALRELTCQTRNGSRRGGRLPDELAALCRDWADVSGIPVDFEAGPLRAGLSAGTGRAAVAIVREALTNVAKHAPTASGVSVVLREHGTHLLVEVADDGPGIDPGRLDPKRGASHGLLGMRERIALLGGTLEIGRGRSGGTRLAAALPGRAAC